MKRQKELYFQDIKDYKDRPSWDELFMLAAYDAATRSSCLFLKTGAVIVKDKRIIATGYNGAPPEIENCLDRGCRKKQKGIDFEEKETGNCRGAHAESNALDQIPRKELKGAVMYSVFFPCTHCAKRIVSNSLSELVYSIIYREPDSLTKELFSESGIRLRQLTPDIEKQFIRLKRIYNQRARNKR